MKTVTLRNGVTVPALGMGTWNIGDSAARRSDEIESLRQGLEAGLRVVDTAEMYGNGRSEELVGKPSRMCAMTFILSARSCRPMRRMTGCARRAGVH